MTTHTAPRRATLIAALLAATALGAAAVGYGHADSRGDAGGVTPQPGAIQPSGPGARLPDFVALVRQVKPAVVSITSKIRDDSEEAQGGGPGGGQGGMQQMPFPFGMPFGGMMQQQPHRAVEARGSGFIIDPSGIIVTNNHVVKDASSVSITMDDGTVLAAKVLGHDARTDVAVLKVQAKTRLPFINLGDSNTVEPGEWVVAVGNPFGLGGTVTAGIVSARGRDIGEGPYDSFIQVDAPINQGNSGGPLFTQDGKVIGINTAIISPNGGGSVGIGFAIPSNTVRNVVAQLEKSGHVTRGYIGVQAQVVSASMAGALHLPDGSGDERGALIASVEPDSPASSGGLQPGDVVTAVNGQHVGNPRDLALNVSNVVPGHKATLDIIRSGHARSVDLTVATLSADQATGPNGQTGSQGLGVSLSPITPQLRQQLSLQDSARGAVITDIKPGSVADQAGLQPGDVIIGVGDHAVSGPADAASAIRAATKGGAAIALRVLRNGVPVFVGVQPGDGGTGDDDGNG